MEASSVQNSFAHRWELEIIEHMHAQFICKEGNKKHNKAANQIKPTHLLEVLGFYYTRDRYSTRPGRLTHVLVKPEWAAGFFWAPRDPLQINMYDMTYFILLPSHVYVHIASLQPHCFLSPYALFAQLLTNALLGTACSFRFHETDAARASYCRNGTVSILSQKRIKENN